MRPLAVRAGRRARRLRARAPRAPGPARPPGPAAPRTSPGGVRAPLDQARRHEHLQVAPDRRARAGAARRRATPRPRAGREPRDDPQPVRVDERAEAGEQRRRPSGASLRSRAARPPLRFGRCSPTAGGSAPTCRSATAWSRPRTARPRSARPTIQVFTDNPTSWRRRPTLPEELPAFRERLAALDIAPLAIHAPYLVNLAGPEPAFHEQSIDRARQRAAGRRRAYGAPFVNVHIGSHRGEGADAGLARLDGGDRRGPGARRRAAPTATPPGDVAARRSRTAPAAGSGSGRRSRSSRRSTRGRAARGVDPARLGFCLDAAHLWGAGYPIDTAAGVDAVVDAFDERVGLDRLRLVHLNDSRSELRLARRPPRARRRGADRRRRASRRLLTHPALGARRVPPRDPGHGRGLRRDQPRPRRAASPPGGRSPTCRRRRSRPAARRAAAPRPTRTSRRVRRRRPTTRAPPTPVDARPAT